MPRSGLDLEQAARRASTQSSELRLSPESETNTGMTETTWRRRGVVLLLPMFLTLGACSEDTPTEPRLDVAAVAGTYTMTGLSFDPQGSLPATDILAELTQAPTLTLTTNRQVQILMRDPITTLVVTINGEFQTTTSGVRLEFGDQSSIDRLLLSTRQDLTFDQQTGTLSFSGSVPGGVDRTALIALVPSLEDEQLLDPTPGTLAVEFTRD